MDVSSLTGFVRAVLDERRIRFGDVRRLQRNLLPRGITTRDEAETLLALDRAIAKADPAWTEFLVAAVRRFVVESGERGDAGRFGTVEWLRGAIGDPPTRTGTAIAREIIIEAKKLGDALAGLAQEPRRPARPQPAKDLEPPARRAIRATVGERRREDRTVSAATHHLETRGVNVVTELDGIGTASRVALDLRRD